MSDEHKVQFLKMETELRSVLSALEGLKSETDAQKSQRDQLESSTQAIEATGEQIEKQVESYASLMSDVSKSLQSAVDALKPIGTVEVSNALEAMRKDFADACSHIEKHVEELSGSSRSVEQSVRKAEDFSSQLPAALDRNKAEISDMVNASSKQAVEISEDISKSISKNKDDLSDLFDRFERQIRDSNQAKLDQFTRSINEIVSDSIQKCSRDIQNGFDESIGLVFEELKLVRSEMKSLGEDLRAYADSQTALLLKEIDQSAPIGFLRNKSK